MGAAAHKKSVPDSASAAPATAVPAGFVGLVDLITAGAFRGKGRIAQQRSASRWWARLAAGDRTKINGRCLVSRTVALPDGTPAGAFLDGVRAKDRLGDYVAPDGSREWSEKNRRRFIDTRELLRREQACREKYPRLDGQRFAAVFAAEHGPWAREHGLSCNPRTIRRYAERTNQRRAYFDGNTDNRGRHRRDGEPAGCSPEAWLFFQQLYLGGVGAPSVAECHRITEAVAAKNEWAWPSLRTIQLRTEHEIPEAVRTYYRKGKRAYAAQHEPKIHRNYEDLPAGAWYCLDGRQFDFWGRVPDVRKGWRRARFVVIGVLDVRSRMFVGWAIGTVENSDLILRALKMALLEYGVPRDITIDNGEGFKAAFGVIGRRRELADDPRIGHLCEQLGVTLHRSIPYHAWSKLVESIWRQQKDGHDRWFWSFTGGSPSERHEDVEAEIKLRIDQLPTQEEVETQFAAWLGGYHATGKSGSGTYGFSPNLIMEQFRTEVRPPGRELIDILTCRLEGPVTVTRDGVRWRGVLYGQKDDEVWKLQGRQVWLRIDPVEVGAVIVCDEAGNRICEAINERLLGATREQQRESAQTKARRRKVVREYAEARDGLLQPTTAQVLEIKQTHARAKEAEIRKTLPPPPRPAEVWIVRPEVVGSAPRARRRAAGAAEGVIDPFVRLAERAGAAGGQVAPDKGESVGAMFARLAEACPAEDENHVNVSAPDWATVYRDDVGMDAASGAPSGPADRQGMAAAG